MKDTAHILVVDDDPGIRRMFQMLLTSGGYRVSAASTAEEALAYLELVTPDLILMDMNLPGMNGEEATARIKADTSKPFIPIMLVTARGDQKSKVSGLDAGADDFLVKPVELNELLARVRAMLRLQRSQRSLRAEQRKTELLLHLTRELGASLDMDQLLTHFLDKLADAVGAIRASIILVAEDQPRLYSSTRNRPTTALSDILRDGIAGWVLRERRAVVIDETRDDRRWVASTPAQLAVRSVAAAPIIREDRALGAITLVHHTPGYFTSEHLDLLSSVAAQCAVALENVELFRLTRRQKDLLERRAEELQRINQVSRYLTELMSPEQLVRLVVHLIYGTFSYPQVAMLTREGDSLVVSAVAGDEQAERRLGARLLAGSGVAGWAVAHQQALYVPDVQQDERFGSEGYVPSLPGQGVRSMLAVPIMSARSVFGALEIASAEPDAFGPNDVRLLDTLAGQLGVAMENAQLFEIEQRRVRQLERANDLSIRITARLDLNENLHIAAEAIGAIFGAPTCGIAVTGAGFHENPRLAVYSARSLEANGVLRFPLPIQQLAAIDLRAPEVIADAAADERLAAAGLDRAGIEALALAPLLSAGRQIGVIAIDATGRLEQFGHSELTLLETVAGLIAQVLENARLYREVEDERSTLNAVLRGAADPILLIDPHDRLLLANRAAQERLHIVAGLRQPIEELDLEPDLRSALSNGFVTPEAHIAHEVTLRDGETFSVSVAPVRGADDSLLGRVAVIQDITAIKELERREQERLRSVFRRYVSPQVAEEVLAGVGDFGEPDERDVVVLIADLRGYTALTEGLPPRVLVEQVLNRYFTAMTEVLYRYGGTIDKFLGDGIIGLFGVPIARADDAERSLVAAAEMQRVFAELRQTWRAELQLNIGMGIGMGYGSAVVGNIGSTQRLDYTVIGDVVNTASRLSGLAGADQIIVSHSLVDKLARSPGSGVTLRELGRVPLKGKQEPHLVYEAEYERAASDRPVLREV